MIKYFSLDKIDRYVLFELDQKGRISAADLGRQLSVSKETINNRIARLEQRGIISHYSPIVNIAKLGLTPYGVFARLEGSDDKRRTKFINTLVADETIYSVALLGGNYDIFFAIQARNIIEFDRILTRLTNEFSGFIGKLDISTRIEVSHFRRGYLVNRKVKTNAPYFGRELEQEELDSLDLSLLKQLAGRGRMPVTELAATLTLPRSTVNARLKNLEKRKIIQSYVSLIHPELYGYQINKLLIAVDNKSVELRDRLFAYCNVHPNVTFFVHSVGKWDYEMTCEVSNQHELQVILSDLRAEFSGLFSNIETIIIFDNMVKYWFFR